jgi:sulfite reductase (NADPH) flavoprotein alpha-component
MDINKLKQIIAGLTREEQIWISGYLTSALSDGAITSAVIDESKKEKLTIFYGTETGNSKQLASDLAGSLQSAFIVKTQDLEIYKAAKLAKETKAIFIVSTHGEGEFPEAVKGFYEDLIAKKLDLNHLSYALIALGDSSYPLFCQSGKDLDKSLSEFGAKHIIPRVDLDLDYNDHIQSWIGNFTKNAVGSAVAITSPAAVSKVDVNKVYQGEILANINLSDDGSNVEIRHIEITSDEEIVFTPGDSLSIALKPDDEYVKSIGYEAEKIAPRLYSIASSADYHDGEVHLTVRVAYYQDANGETKSGLCSGYLASLEEGTKIEFTIKPNNQFRLPAHEANEDIILIGPGTGLAPFRSFLADRAANGCTGKNWLFFGAQHFQTDFLYQTEIQEFVAQGLLNKVSLAFSRDQEHKIYVQDRMQEEAKEFFDWINNGARIYVCGDKEHMAKDVENTLLNIIKTHANLDEDGAKEYLYNLKEQNRYLKDVY